MPRTRPLPARFRGTVVLCDLHYKLGAARDSAEGEGECARHRPRVAQVEALESGSMDEVVGAACGQCPAETGSRRRRAGEGADEFAEIIAGGTLTRGPAHNPGSVPGSRFPVNRLMR